MNRTGPVQTVIRCARRRRTRLLALEELGFALDVMLAGIILMLVLGTGIFSAYWLVLAGAAAAGIAAYRVYAKRMPLYRVAQIIDSRLGLSDSLSTAWFLLSSRDSQEHPAAYFQVVGAERIARAVDASRVFRFGGRRWWTLAAGLAGVAFGLFAIRYLTTRSLDLKPALISAPVSVAQAFERIERALVPDHGHESTQDARVQRAAGNLPDDVHGERLTNRNFKEVDGATGGAQAGATQDQHGTANDAQATQAGQTQAGSSSRQLPGQNAQPQGTPPSAKPESGPPGSEASEAKKENTSGLMDRMKEALSGLMAKLRSEKANRGEDQASQSRSPGAQDSAKERSSGMQQSAKNSDPAQDANAAAQGQARTTEKTSSAQSRSSQESADQKSADSQSGIGHTNGDKEIKTSEELKAMGKLAEIIGKRSANLTGDMAVETPTSGEQLKTQYSGRTARHSDSGGEINRDEIPVMYRDYVRDYMELVHKQAEERH